MLWSNEYWKRLRDKAYKIARALGASHVDADDIAQTAVLALEKRCDRALAGEAEPLDNPGGYLYRTIMRLVAKPQNGRRWWEELNGDEVFFEEAGDGSGDLERYALQCMVHAGAIRQVLQFGEQQERGHVAVLVRESRFDPSSVEMADTYIEKLLDEAPADDKTRRKAKKKYRRLMARALRRVEVDTETVLGDVDREDSGLRGWAEADGVRRELSGNATEGVELLRLLIPSMAEPVAMEHAIATERKVWAGRDRGTSLWAFGIHDNQEDDGIREVEDELKELWRWTTRKQCPKSWDGNRCGELTVTGSTGSGEVTIRVMADQGMLMLDAPTGEMCFGQPLPVSVVAVVVDDLEYDPPDEESDCFHMDLEIRKKDHNARVASFIFETLEVYGWAPVGDFEWACEFWVEGDEDEAA